MARHGWRKIALTSLAVLFVILISGGLTTSTLAAAEPDADQARIDELYKQVAPLQELYELVADKVRPAVVHVATRSVQKIEPGDQNPFPPGSPFNRFFGEDFNKFFNLPREIPRNALGSGVIVDEKGYVLTNNHVVDEATSITVKLWDGDEVEAKVVGRDELSDLAVLKFDPGDRKLRVATLGDSTNIRVGTMVMAVGSPFGLDATVTKGIISATARAGVGLAKYEDFLQTDAAINPGNSGGPLVNLRGEVIGINAAIVTQSGSFAGVGFAIPSSMAKKVMDDLIAKGRVVRGWLGVMIQSLSPDLAEQFGLAKSEGALVSQVYPETPAAKAGIRRGDIIIEFDGQKITSSAQLMNLVAVTPVDKKVKIKVIRERKPLEFEVAITERTEAAVSQATGQGGEATTTQLGITVQTLTPELADQLGYKDEQGVVVTNVDPASLAAERGIGKGNLIVEVNRQKVTSAEQYNEAMKNADLKKGVLLLVRSPSGGSSYVVLAEK